MSGENRSLETSETLVSESGKGPYLIVGAFWSATDITDEVAEALHSDVFPRPDGFRGAVVSFRYEVANSGDFRNTMRRLDLHEVNDRKPGYAGETTDEPCSSPDSGSEAQS